MKCVTKWDKELEKMKNNPTNISKEKLVALLYRFSCIIREGKGSHFSVTHHSVDYTLTIPNNKPIKKIYIKNCIKLIDEVKQYED